MALSTCQALAAPQKPLKGVNKCNGMVGQDGCMPKVCPPLRVDKGQLKI